jgi:hypothetical protein
MNVLDKQNPIDEEGEPLLERAWLGETAPVD